jgi:hypothetical protein
MTYTKEKSAMKNILLYLIATLTLLTLAACGGGGGGGGGSTTNMLYFSSGGNGTLSGETRQAVNTGGSSSVVTAVPASGYHFVNWTEAGSEVSTNAALTVPAVNAGHSFTAHFAADTQAKTTATVAINLTGTLPPATAISGVTFTLILPADVIPKTTNGAVDAGVVTLSGNFAGSTIAPHVSYTSATASTAGSLKVILTSSKVGGVPQTGEVAKITLKLANGAAPTAAGFGLIDVGVIDTVLYGTITGMGVNVASVTLE